MPKPRNKENRGLPARWKVAHGAYYYNVPIGHESSWDGKKLFRLGKTLPEAYKEWARRIESMDKASTVAKLLDRYACEVIPEKAAATRESHVRRIKKIREVFGHMPLASVTPQHIYKYADKRGNRACMRLEVSILTHAFTKAVEWGDIASHPFKGEIRLAGGKARTRYVEDWEFNEALSLSAPSERGGVAMIQGYIGLKLLLGLRQTDMLLLGEECVKDDGIHVTPRKTHNTSGKSIIYEWTDSLREAVEKARKARPVAISEWLFCTRSGDCYIDDNNGRAFGFSSVWQRFMDRLLEETQIKERFAERDIRAKTASDAVDDKHAQDMLGHTDSKTTRKFYRRKPEKVKPLR